MCWSAPRSQLVQTTWRHQVTDTARRRSPPAIWKAIILFIVICNDSWVKLIELCASKLEGTEVPFHLLIFKEVAECSVENLVDDSLVANSFRAIYGVRTFDVKCGENVKAPTTFENCYSLDFFLGTFPRDFF